MNNKRQLYFFSGLAMVALLSLYFFYRLLFGISIRPEGERAIIYIPEGASYDQAMDSVKSDLKIRNHKVLEWVAKKKNYPSLVKPGRYVIDKGLSYNNLINILRSGRQTSVKITFNNIRTLNDLAGKVGGQIEADSSQIISFLSDPENYKNDGFTRENVISVFIPNTYELLWNTGASRLYTRMLKEYRKFWNKDRLKKAEEIKLSPVEVAILASIIDDEVAKPDEKPRIAGVYLNRLKRGIPLQACPTIKFALNDFTITRVLYKHLQTDSPYNTYKHSGFPPGPIGGPTVEGIDAVLNAEKHDYLFFAAKADFSGYHNFSRTLSEHNRYAALYQRELNKKKIFK
jgi:UPF0755 protein